MVQLLDLVVDELLNMGVEFLRQLGLGRLFLEDPLASEVVGEFVDSSSVAPSAVFSIKRALQRCASGLVAGSKPCLRSMSRSSAG
jgi:hypothetical protein